ncbi:hypothetical protein [Spirosoma spitsbergense]|uniref:hypothetical protein n=1 Tax=Spirosoma spitsbergense TaxID=431554 RepID=UPI000360C5DE|nr:hypothetical protein [Spirosoma spitsbergense]
MTFIPQRAEQEFYDELNERLANQPGEWQVLANDQKAFLLSPSDFDYLLKLYQQHQPARPIDTDETGSPILLFRGIRVKPI